MRRFSEAWRNGQPRRTGESGKRVNPPAFARFVILPEGKMHVAGQYYHVYNRGCNRGPIFSRPDNYLFFLCRLKAYCALYPVAVIGYCLMPNHYHLLLRPGEDGASSRLVQRLCNSYTQAYNQERGRSGTLFEGRAKSVHVDRDEYATYLCRYIHLNPVDAGLVAMPEDWPYSNYLEWVGRREGSLVDPAFARMFFPDGASYETFVLGEIAPELGRAVGAYYLED